jgi:hypothetical protein
MTNDFLKLPYLRYSLVCFVSSVLFIFEGNFVSASRLLLKKVTRHINVKIFLNKTINAICFSNAHYF